MHFDVGAVQVHIDLTGSSQPAEDIPDGILPSTLGDTAFALNQIMGTWFELLTLLSVMMIIINSLHWLQRICHVLVRPQ